MSDTINIKVYVTKTNRLVYNGTDLYEATFTANTSVDDVHMIMTRGDKTGIYKFSKLTGWSQ